MASCFSQSKQSLPFLGIGLGLRRDIAERTLSSQAHIDWLELVPENYMGVGGKARLRLEQAAASFPLVSHGVNLSLGSFDPLNKGYLSDLKVLLDEFDCPWWSDHLSFSSAGGVYAHDLLPLPFTREAVDHVSERIRRVQDYICRPFLIENISAYMRMPGAQMSESDFISSVLEFADCGLLLDVDNVFVNSMNFGFDPYEFIDSLPLERVVQIHVAGHKRRGKLIIDTHGEKVSEAVFAILEYVLMKVEVKGILLERDQNFPEFDDILEELEIIRCLARECAAAGRVDDRRSIEACP